MRRLLISSLLLLTITATSALAADENTTLSATKSSALAIALAPAETQQLAVGSTIATPAGGSAVRQSPEAFTRPQSPEPSGRPSMLPAMYATSVGLQGFDIYSTLSVLHLGGAEQNPLMKSVVGSPATVVATKATVTAASIVAAERLWRTNHRMSAIGLMLASNAMMAIVATHNAGVLSAMK